MNYWKKVIAKDSGEYKEFLKGTLFTIGSNGVIRNTFKYATVAQRKYATMVSMLPGDFVEPTETIYTTAIDLPFTKGSTIKLNDGSNMTVRDIENIVNEDTGKLKAIILYLAGGVPNEFN